MDQEYMILFYQDQLAGIRHYVRNARRHGAHVLAADLDRLALPTHWKLITLMRTGVAR